jgi:hypothetical protein
MENPDENVQTPINIERNQTKKVKKYIKSVLLPRVLVGQYFQSVMT